jgi:hypothetical protein
VTFSGPTSIVSVFAGAALALPLLHAATESVVAARRSAIVVRVAREVVICCRVIA